MGTENDFFNNFRYKESTSSGGGFFVSATTITTSHHRATKASGLRLLFLEEPENQRDDKSMRSLPLSFKWRIKCPKELMETGGSQKRLKLMVFHAVVPKPQR